MLSPVCVLFAVLAAELLQRVHIAGIAGGTELIDGELYFLEQLTGVVVAAVAAALLIRDAAVINRDQQMGVAFQADDGELPQRHIKCMAGIRNHSERFVENVENLFRNRGNGAGHRAGRRCADISIQQNGLHRFHHSVRIGRGDGNMGAGLVAAAGRGHKQLSAAVAAEQNGSLGENGKTGDRGGAGTTGVGFTVDLVVVSQIDRIKTAVHLQGVNGHYDGNQRGMTTRDTLRVVEDFLGRAREIDAQIFDAVFGLTGVEDFFRMNTSGFSNRIRVTTRTGHRVISHEKTSC